MDNEKIKRPLPKTAFDSEYKTEFLREVRFLAEKGIKYVFVKKTADYGISQYKYKKTPALFAALVEFYSMIEAEKAVKKKDYTKAPEVNVDLKLSTEKIQEAQEILKLAAEQIKNQEDDTL